MYHNLKYGTLLVAFAIVTGSCSLFKSSSVSGSEASQTETVDAVTSATTVENKTTDSKKSEPKSSTQHKISGTKVANNIDGEWYIQSVGKTKIEQDEDVPYIVFESETGRFYANNGCNTLNGSFAVSAENAITFSNVLSTMRLCPDVKYESDINAILADGVTVNASFVQIAGDSYLHFTNNKSHELMKLRRHSLGFLNGNWQVVSINGSKISDDDATIFFDIAELKIHGNTGCNYFNGEIYIYPNKSNAIDFSNMAVTRMACPKTTQETAMLVALEQTQTVVKSDKDHAILLDASGKEVMKLKRLAIKAE
jgi:heat shock protein HslJ